MVSGLALVDKPTGVSSHGVVGAARRALGTKKVGHAGTLDPAASGLLVLGVGQGTRLLTFCVGMDKTYQATMRLGYATTTDDAEGERIDVAGGSLEACTAEAIDLAIATFVGDILQVPSSFSAIKVDGVRAYDRARAGEAVELKARPVTVYRLERGQIERGESYIDVELIIECSSGTYIRALARDIGQGLGVGGHLVRLRRSVVGPFTLRDAVSPEELEPRHVMSMEDAASAIMPTIRVSGPAREDLRHGRSVSDSSWPEGGPFAAIDDETGLLVAVVGVSQGRSRILMGVAAGTD